MRLALLVVLVAACGRAPERCAGAPPRCSRSLAGGGTELVAAECVAGRWMCGVGTTLADSRAVAAPPARALTPPRLAATATVVTPKESRPRPERRRRAADPGGRCAGEPPLCFRAMDGGACTDRADDAFCDAKRRRWRCAEGYLLASRCTSIGTRF